jgi:hypothetical protein
MSQAPDRIPVPTNGKGPHRTEPAQATDAEATPPATVAFTPTQLAVGFGILASLVLLVAGGIRRRNRSRSGGPFGRR